MADHFEILGVRKGDELIRLLEIPGLVRRTERRWLHAILGRHMAELSRQQRPVRRAVGNPVGQTYAGSPRRSLPERLGRPGDGGQQESEKEERRARHRDS